MRLGSRSSVFWIGDNSINSDVGGADDEQIPTSVDGNDLDKVGSQPVDEEPNDVALSSAEPILRTYEPPIRRDLLYDPTLDETIWQKGLVQNFEFENWWRSGGREESLPSGT